MSHSGETIRYGIRAVGGDPDRFDLAQRKPGELEAFIELHIEQGAFLHEDGIAIGVVEGIVGIRWWDVVVEGVAEPCGHDTHEPASGCPAVRVRARPRREPRRHHPPGRYVATVGRIRAEPGAPNVIPGRVVMSLEIRDLAAENIQKVFDAIRHGSQPHRGGTADADPPPGGRSYRLHPRTDA